MLKISQLLNLTSNQARRSASHVKILGFKESDKDNEKRYAAIMIGKSREKRYPVIHINQTSGAAHVRCTCTYFKEVLILPLAMVKSLLGTADHRGKAVVKVMRVRPSLCSHLVKLALLAQTTDKNTTKKRLREAKVEIPNKLKNL